MVLWGGSSGGGSSGNDGGRKTSCNFEFGNREQYTATIPGLTGEGGRYSVECDKTYEVLITAKEGYRLTGASNRGESKVVVSRNLSGLGLWKNPIAIPVFTDGRPS